jgi:hypothetical protein
MIFVDSSKNRKSTYSHNNLTGLELSSGGAIYGHINDQTQNIVGLKTFNNQVNTLTGYAVNGTALSVNGKSLTGAITLELDSTDFVNQGTTTTVLHGNGAGSPTWQAIVEDDIYLQDNTTNNVNAVRHGFAPILSNNADQFLNGQGNWTSVPTGVLNSYKTQAFSNQTSVNIIHNFGAYPVIQIIDNTGAVLIPLSITNNSLNDFTVTFAISTSGNIIASVGSPQPMAITDVNSDYFILITDRIIVALAEDITITLPVSSGNLGREFIIDNDSTGNITLSPSSGELIQGETSQTIPFDSAINVYSNNTGWRIF